MTRFSSCTGETSEIAIVEAGVKLAEQMGINATPTVFVNGWRYRGCLTPTGLERIIQALRAGKRPYESLQGE